MKFQLPILFFLTLLIMVTQSHAGTAVAKRQPPVPPSGVPEGLASSDWESIRAAYDAGRHAFQPAENGWQARSPGQQWLATFDGQGFTVTPNRGGWTWGLELIDYGQATDIQQQGTKISFSKADGLTEWFVNDARGLEQGWTLAKRPERAGIDGPVSLDLAVRGGLIPRISPEGASVAFTMESGAAVLTYGGLKAWDVEGKTVPVRFAGTGESIDKFQVVIDDTEAKYPITVDPIAQQAYLKASNTGAWDVFAESVSVSGDTVVVGASLEDSSATGVDGNQADNTALDSGAAYVFVRNGTSWVQQAYLKASNTGINDQFGRSVAVSGNTVVVGAYNEDSSATAVNGEQSNDWATESGAAYVFVRSGSTWSQEAYLKATNSEAQWIFGYSVAISGDTVVVGAYGADSIISGGAAYVFVRSGTTWNQQANLTGSNKGTTFGFSVALSEDTVVVGDPWEGNSGAAYVFGRDGTSWTQQAYLKASNAGAEDWFGHSVGVSGDTVVVGAYGEDSSAKGINGDGADNAAPNSGAAYVFVRDGTSWSQQAYVKASNAGTQDTFGASVGISGDRIVVGAYREASSAIGINGDQSDNSGLDSGAAYVFARAANVWSQQAYLKTSNRGPDWFGSAVSISGNTAVVGAWFESSSATGVNGDQTDDSAFSSGAAYVFNLMSEYSITTSAVNGTVSGAGEYSPGSTATLTATAAPGYVFTGWTGDASGT